MLEVLIRAYEFMFIILLTYKKPLVEIEKHLKDHRDFLDAGYKKDYFVASGPRNPRTGGVIISQLTDHKQLDDIIHQDPFHIHDLADYTIIEFSPIKHHKDFAPFLSEY
jgi:uncharacterized protein YciI